MFMVMENARTFHLTKGGLAKEVLQDSHAKEPERVLGHGSKEPPSLLCSHSGQDRMGPAGREGHGREPEPEVDSHN